MKLKLEILHDQVLLQNYLNRLGFDIAVKAFDLCYIKFAALIFITEAVKPLIMGD